VIVHLFVLYNNINININIKFLVAVGGPPSGHPSTRQERVVHPLPAKKGKMNVF